WPIYACAQELDLPLGIHVGGYGGHAPTGGGWPSYYAEEHQSNAHSVAAQLASLVIEGVPERFPRLKIVFIEGGFGWIAATTWRMDQHFERFRDEVPHLKRRPSEYVREHFWFTTQPIDEPDEARHLRSLIEWVGVDRLTSPEPGCYQRSRVGELLRCAWHGWEFDMRTGQSYFDPNRVMVRTYPVVIEDGDTLAKGPYVVETFPVHVEDSYVIVET